MAKSYLLSIMPVFGLLVDGDGNGSDGDDEGRDSDSKGEGDGGGGGDYGSNYGVGSAKCDGADR